MRTDEGTLSPLAVRHDRHRTGFPPADNQWLATPEAQPIIARIAANVDPDYRGRDEHILRIASIVIHAKRHPANKFAQATL